MATIMEAGMFIMFNIHACVYTHAYACMHVCAHMCGGAPTQRHPHPPTHQENPLQISKNSTVKG